jgi:phosphoglycolate phosphatase-like HAD superfamily hydrolase
MSPGFGPAPILDFDGTIARLPVAWADLRARLGVPRIDDLWNGPADVWQAVTDVETDAAAHATPVAAVVERLAGVQSFAVVTSNSEAAVARFFADHPALGDRATLVVGRETLAGPKTDLDVFRRGYARCVEATGAARGDGRVVYVGDMAYELQFAAELGAHAIDVASLG